MAEKKPSVKSGSKKGQHGSLEKTHTTAAIDGRHLVSDGVARDKNSAYRHHRPNSKIFEKEDELKDVRQLLESKDETLHEVVGTGTFADVYRGVNHRLNKVIAVKIIDLKKTSAHYREQLLPQEIAIIKQLKHPRIVKIYHISQVGYKVVLVMEFASKGTLSDLICSIGALKEPVAWTMFRDVLEGLGYMHHRSIAHRDLKLENILINHNNLPKLADFSFAVYFDGHTLCTNHCGSIPYFAPEMLSNAPYHPLLSDVWSMAVCIYITTNDTFPFRIGDDRAMLAAQLAKAWKFRTRTEQTFSEAYKSLIKAMLQPDPAKRIRTEEILRHSWITTEQRTE
ncbi:PREDICTED: testis-specific serine/threonine-protein kinase 2-like [Rhagoletis zephyria]|uniref:testis-specific serine/threonine-protein kinase 2-like n=1 Tax=Rhagoletis zephyria TaxID=28612 RepID=UPI0008117126|nr:PREDICTED: testis-specific serine/threonine-protein kinase 2-like [Rhagoletis zephyria]KAH9395285.1 protein serine threonine kinase [Tyrophagus putrescentiae]